ncbi:MAG: NRDE family protein, partial [Zoogloeaceae bacterium]|nr:NRDE family protein [Zoogloeaceae bacterium]
EPEAFFHGLADRARAPDRDLPHTGVPLAVERLLSAIFIASPDYGTRASTLLLAHRDGHFCLTERRVGPEGVCLGEVTAQTLPIPA